MATIRLRTDFTGNSLQIKYKIFELPKVIIAAGIALIIAAHNRYLRLTLSAMSTMSTMSASSGKATTAATHSDAHSSSYSASAAATETTMRVAANAVIVQLAGLRCRILIGGQIALRRATSCGAGQKRAGNKDNGLQHLVALATRTRKLHSTQKKKQQSTRTKKLMSQHCLYISLYIYVYIYICILAALYLCILLGLYLCIFWCYSLD